ncbi:hypothetical protein Glove_388g13 [Diversispora epigaea]|uniref:Uncharacterized protein n=1 Tax=Diversispora epigaea TaxID=1348612 RepID=A0A397HAK1_9GLOM|nr:hypothetical protein Glove_388g13 [Diversispora epigaea]
MQVASTHTPMMYKRQVATWTIDMIIDSGLSISIISKTFADHIKRLPDRESTRTITGIHGDQKESLGIINDIPVHVGDVIIIHVPKIDFGFLSIVIISTDMEIIDTRAYTMVLENDWLRKAHAKIEYFPPRLTINNNKCMAVIECKNTLQKEFLEKEEKEEDEDEEDESSDEDEDEEIIGLNSLCLIVSEEENHESFSWEEYQFINEKFNPWLKDQRYQHKYKHWFKEPDKLSEEKCTQCKEDYERWCTLQVIPTQDIRTAYANLVMEGSERLSLNEHKNEVEQLLNQYPQVIARDITEIG